MASNFGFILDTNVFNHVLDGKLGDVAALQALKAKGYRLFATHVQQDEIEATSDGARKAALRAMFEAVFVSGPNALTESAVWDVSKWGYAKWGDDGDGLAALIAELDQRRKKDNNKQDALIAHTALGNGWVLITGDAVLFGAATKFGVACGNALLLSLV